MDAASQRKPKIEKSQNGCGGPFKSQATEIEECF
jgi:hypothetical protein